MKYVLVSMILLFGFGANAEVKAPGTFLAVLCSDPSDSEISTGIGLVQSVCMGSIVGSDRSAFELILTDGTTRLYEVVFETVDEQLQSYFIGGLSRTGNQKDISMTDGIIGALGFQHGKDNYVELETQSSLKFEGSLQFVFNSL